LIFKGLQEKVPVPLSPHKHLKTSVLRWFFYAHSRTKLASVSGMGIKNTERRRRTGFQMFLEGLHLKGSFERSVKKSQPPKRLGPDLFLATLFQT